MPVPRAAAPYSYRCPVGLAYPSCRVACLDAIEAVIEKHHAEVAALIVEPLVLGAAGMVVYPTEYLERLVRLARARGILVIFDEVFTGFGRTGTFFAMDQVAPDARPDIVCLSKGLTAGMMPLAATVARRGIFEVFGGPDRAFYHGHTYTGNPLGCAVALESLAIFEEERTLEKNARLSAVMAGETERFRALPVVGEVRHLGMIWAAELVTDKASKKMPQPANGPGWRVAQRLWDQGFWIRPLHNMVYCVPTYASTESELRDFFQLLYSSLSEETDFGGTSGQSQT
jgi:adenosylmethionine-8-amino-7-oxononanoate aminotransferase